jgi:hypothetical protein
LKEGERKDIYARIVFEMKNNEVWILIQHDPKDYNYLILCLTELAKDGTIKDGWADASFRKFLDIQTLPP